METRLLEFEQHVEVDSGCWHWRGPQGPRGYGQYSRYRAHRVAYLKWNGPIPAGRVVRHACDNRLCVNPTHLALGTPAQNSQDMKDRGRQARGEKHSQVKVTEAAVRQIRSMIERHVPQRAIAERFGIDPSTVSDIKRGKSWGWLS